MIHYKLLAAKHAAMAKYGDGHISCFLGPKEMDALNELVKDTPVLCWRGNLMFGMSIHPMECDGIRTGFAFR